MSFQDSGDNYSLQNLLFISLPNSISDFGNKLTTMYNDLSHVFLSRIFYRFSQDFLSLLGIWFYHSISSKVIKVTV